MIHEGMRRVRGTAAGPRRYAQNDLLFDSTDCSGRGIGAEVKARRKGQAGTSLVEIVVSAGIAAVATFFIFKMVVLSFAAWSEGEGRIRFQERTAQGMQRIAREVRQADETSLSVNGVSLSFRMPEDLDGDGTIIDSEGVTEFGPEITYSLSGGALLREQDINGNDIIEDGVPGEKAVIASGLTAIDFQSASVGVWITMTLEILPNPLRLYHRPAALI